MKHSDYKRLKKIISDESYDPPQRCVPRLLNLGYIKPHKWTERTYTLTVSFSCYIVTEEGKLAINEYERILENE